MAFRVTKDDQLAMSLRPSVEVSSALLDRETHAFQVRCTIAAARAAHALFERQCMSTGGGGNKRKLSQSNASGSPSDESHPPLETKPKRQHSGDTSGGSSTESVESSSLENYYDGFLDNVKKVVEDLINANPGPYVYTLVDGNNIATCKPLVGHTKDALNSAVACLPDEKSVVVVIWTWKKWKESKLDETNAAGIKRRKQYAANFNALRDPDTNVFFVLLKYEHEKEDAKRVKTLEMILQEGGNISWKHFRNERVCKLPGFEEHDHLACELDDVLLTKFHSELLKQAMSVRVVSADRNVLKMPFEVEKVGNGVKDAMAELDPSLTLVEVPLVEVPT